MSRIDCLPVGVRGHAVRSPDKQKKRPTGAASVKRQPVTLPRYLVVVDTETTIDESQRFNFGCAHFYALSWDSDTPSLALLAEYLIYADDLPARYPSGMQALQRYVRSRRNQPKVDFQHRLAAFGGIHLISRSVFTRKLQRAAADARACICAFNFPFDISRLATSYEMCRTGRCTKGFGFTLHEHPDGNPNKYPARWGSYNLGPHKAINTLLPGIDDLPYNGNIVDLSQLVFALTAEGHSLESACDAYDVKFKKRKVKHGKINARYITYCREDVEATASLYRAAMTEYLCHPINLDAKEAYSPASIGKSYLKRMGITPLAERGISNEVNGYADTSYYGGRADCRIRRAPPPVQPYDFKSQYPIVCSLLDIWSLLIADQIVVRDQSPRDLSRWLDNLTVEDCYNPATWQKMRAIALIEPDGHILPVRAKYSDHVDGWGIGVNHYTSKEPVWYTLPDIIASKHLAAATGQSWKPPTILRVLRFDPSGEVLKTLRPVKLRGKVRIDPSKHDFFRACVEARRVKGCAPELAYFLKILVNATSYGIFAEVNRPEVFGDETVTVYGLDQFTSQTSAPEEAGGFFGAVIAALITGGGRLLLAMLERAVSDLGGTYLSTDTDSMAIVASRDGGYFPCPGGPYRDGDGRECVRALSWEQTDAIAERFASLNPYSESLVPGSILELEECATDEATGERHELWGYAISAKRYCYYTHEPDGSIKIRKASEHGLGQYLNPIDPEHDEGKGKRGWIRDVWEHIVRTDVLGEESDTHPEWYDRPAIRKHPISTPTLLRPLETLHPELGYQERVKPFGFMAIATPSDRRALPSTPFALVQPFSTDPVKWAEDPWINFHDGPNGTRYRIAHDPDGLSGFAGDYDSSSLQLFKARRNASIVPRKNETLFPAKTLADVLFAFQVHPEAKSAAPNGSPCSTMTRGLLRRRHVSPAGSIVHLGKETNQLEERLAGLHYGDDDVQTEYTRSEKWELARAILAGRPDSEIASLSELKPHTVASARTNGPTRSSTRSALIRAACSIATETLTENGIKPPRRIESLLATYLATCNPSACPVCNNPLPSGRASYCSQACKQAAYRNRQSTPSPA